MTNQHRATDEQWDDTGAFASATRSCLLELRDRIQQLESAQLPRLPAPAPSPRPFALVDRVADALDCGEFNPSWEKEARAAIREVARWLRSEYPKREGYGTAWADLLDDHADE